MKCNKQTTKWQTADGQNVVKKGGKISKKLSLKKKKEKEEGNFDDDGERWLLFSFVWLGNFLSFFIFFKRFFYIEKKRGKNEGKKSRFLVVKTVIFFLVFILLSFTRPLYPHPSPSPVLLCFYLSYWNGSHICMHRYLLRWVSTYLMLLPFFSWLFLHLHAFVLLLFQRVDMGEEWDKNGGDSVSGADGLKLRTVCCFRPISRQETNRCKLGY